MTIDNGFMTKQTIYTRLDEETVNRMDKWIKKKKFDTRSSFIRLAVIDKLDEIEPKILA